MKTIKIIAIAAALLTGLCCRAQDDVRARFEQEIKANSAVSAIDCRFTQTRSVAVLDSEVKKSGDFSFRRPDSIRLQFDDGDYISMKETDFEIRSEGRTSSMKINSNPMLKELKRLLSACLSGDVTSILAGFNSSINASAETYNLVLTPKNKRASSMMKSMEMEFDRRDMSLNWMKMNENGGDWTRYDFSKKKIEK